MDVSAHLVHAATRQMTETDAMEEQFAGVDELIAQAETQAMAMAEEPGREGVELGEQERIDVDEALSLVSGKDAQGASQPGRAA
ncbi:hypothetical protein [Streptomyces sp. NPDC004830]